MTRFGTRTDHTTNMTPKGRVSRNAGWLKHSACRKTVKTAERRSFVATSRLRHKLHSIEVAQYGNGWCHKVNGEIVATFWTVNEAISAL